MEIYIFGKTQKINSCKTVSQFTQQLRGVFLYLAHDTIKILNCVMGYLNVKTKEKLIGIIDLQLFGYLK